MLKQILILIFLFICFSVTLKAQDIYFSDYPQHQFFYNPAFAGIDSTHDFSLTGRKEDYYRFGSETPAVHSVMLSYNQHFCNFKSGIGGLVYFQNGDNFHRVHIGTAYNYKVNFTKRMNLRIGIGPSIEFYHQDTVQILCFDCGDGLIPGFNRTALDFSLGFRYEWNNFFLGFSTKNILHDRFIISGNTDAVPPYYFDHSYSLKFVAVGNKFNLCKSFSTAPSIFYFFQGQMQRFQFLNDVCFRKIFILGAGGIYNEAAIFRGGINLKNKIQALFSYDYYTSTLARPTNSKGSFEGTIQYRF